VALVPLIRKVRGLKTSTLKHLPLSLAPKGHCGETSVCVVQHHETSISPVESDISMDERMYRVDSRNCIRDVAIILGVCFAVFFYGLGDSAFTDKHEAREALVVSSIYDAGNWILPLRNGSELPFKPPLFHWLSALFTNSVNRVDETTARFPSALLGTLGVLLTYITGTILWGRSAGLVSALVLSTSYEWRQAATQARVDMTLTFVLLCCFLFFFYLYETDGGRDRWKACLFGFLLGLATLAKGPLGFVVPSLSVLIFLWARKDFAFLKKFHPIIVIATCGLVAGSWYALALWQGGREFAFIVLREHLPTLAGGEPSHPHPFYWYLPVFLRNTAPWSLFFLPIGIFLFRFRHRLFEEKLLYFVIWFATVLIFFSWFTQKRSVYILSIYPAMALLFGAWIQKLKTEPSLPGLMLARLMGYLCGASFLLFAALLLIEVTGSDLFKNFYPIHDVKERAQLALIVNLLNDHQQLIFAWAAFCGLGGLALFVAVRKGAWNLVVGCTAVVMVVSFLCLRAIDEQLSQSYSFRNFTQRAMQIVNGDPLFFYGSSSYGVIFYSRRNIQIYVQPVQTATSHCYLLFWESEWEEIENRDSFDVELVSESVDKEIPERGHLLLVKLKGAEAGQDQRKAGPPQSFELLEFKQFVGS
jgi:4-amino-4-deoxy-L-arabinose transferase-like glycosyltransferase